ncbi:hypothetical protein D8Y20_03755 [Mariprofundus sp. EBB-1]|uniref:FIST signal transduction protein n=1 Tax=Mariprofundus sp. EBB-1 TaxID=2650971 RepID=UPI000EF17E95|nr:FIST N-terminal domain-containing protein [Mariprofundus sp. EBB-1]RLL54024.1 hypothetical protein D8Y20_03755 [Mariprofundus sp. EBB-1]
MYFDQIDESSLTEAVSNAAAPYDSPVAVIFLSEKHADNVPDLIKRLKALKVPFIGGLFPALIHGEKAYHSGAIINVFPSAHAPIVVTGLDQDNYTAPDLTELLEANSSSQATAIIFMDAMTVNNTALLSDLFHHVGNRLHFFGGGTGYSDLQHRPSVFTRDGFIKDAAVIAFTGLTSTIGVRHGWQRISEEPLIATRSHKNTVFELNWEPAFDIYKASVQEHGQTDITTGADFHAKASLFPLGLFREGQEDVVRDPIALQESGHIQFVSSVPENSVMHLLHGNSASLIEAASMAVDDCQWDKHKQASHCLIIDCYSRTLALGDAFDTELQAVSRRLKEHGQHCLPEGAVTLGEISSYGDDYLELFNKTVVIGLLHDGLLHE